MYLEIIFSMELQKGHRMDALRCAGVRYDVICIYVIVSWTQIGRSGIPQETGVSDREIFVQ